MALIEVKITAEDPRQLAVILSALAAVHNLTNRIPPAVIPAEEPTANVPEAYGEPEAASEPDAKPARRKRRTKAEIEADKAAAAAEAVGETISTPDAAPTEPEAPTKQDVAKAMEALLESGPAGGEKMIGALMDLGAKNDAGDAKLSSLAEEKYAEAIEKMNALAAEVKKGAGDAARVLE